MRGPLGLRVEVLMDFPSSLVMTTSYTISGGEERRPAAWVLSKRALGP